MNILLSIHHDLDPHSGAPGSVLKLGHAYQALGHTVHYYSFDDLPSWAPEMAKGVLFPQFLAVHLAKLHAHHKFDVIDASTGDAWAWGTILRAFVKTPPLLVTRSHGLEHAVHIECLEDARRGMLKLSWKYPLYNGGLRLWEVATSLRCADLVFLLNRQDLKYSIEQLGISEKKAYVCPNGIPDEFLNLPFDRDPTPEDSTIRIAQVGTYIPRKGIQYGVPALNSILQRHPQVQVSFLGTACPEDQVHANFEPSVRDRVKVVPRFQHATLPALLKNHQIKLFTPLSEGFGKALVEGMACGLAPVTTAAPGPLEIVRDGYDAIVVPMRNSQIIEQALEKLITDQPYLEQLRRNAYNTAQSYSWLNAAQKRLMLYAHAIEQRKQPA